MYSGHAFGRYVLCSKFNGLTFVPLSKCNSRRVSIISNRIQNRNNVWISAEPKWSKHCPDFEIRWKKWTIPYINSVDTLHIYSHSPPPQKNAFLICPFFRCPWLSVWPWPRVISILLNGLESIACCTCCGPKFTDLHSSIKETQLQKCCISFWEECISSLKNGEIYQPWPTLSYPPRPGGIWVELTR